MTRKILVTGGSRSGKSRYALRLGEDAESPRLFIATCPATDEEMVQRIRKHQAERARGQWQTQETPLALAEALGSASQFRTVLVDCLTLWVNNMLYKAQQAGNGLTEDHIEHECLELFRACDRLEGTIIFVTNEVGMGIVPENPTARIYRDLVGRCNQVSAEQADEVWFLACGLPLNLKRRSI
jgi:adenosylcobinamide kinase / adenosylcobinamide-phosphate guanylyltransferase